MRYAFFVATARNNNRVCSSPPQTPGLPPSVWGMLGIVGIVGIVGMLVTQSMLRQGDVVYGRYLPLRYYLLSMC